MTPSDTLSSFRDITFRDKSLPLGRFACSTSLLAAGSLQCALVPCEKVLLLRADLMVGELIPCRNLSCRNNQTVTTVLDRLSRGLHRGSRVVHIHLASNHGRAYLP